MKCSKVQLIIDDTGDLDRLPPDVARHVDACPACREFGLELAALRSLLREPGRVKAPEDFDARLSRRLRAGGQATPVGTTGFRGFFMQPALAGAAALVLVGAASFAVIQSLPTAAPPDIASNVNAPAPGVTTDIAGLETPAPPDSPAPLIPSVVPVDANTLPRAETNGHAPSSHERGNRVRGRQAKPAGDEAMVLVRDDLGTRVVSVPSILVGSETILPGAGLAAAGASGEVVSF